MGKKSNIPIDTKQYPDLKIENPSLHYEFGEIIGRYENFTICVAEKACTIA